MNDENSIFKSHLLVVAIVVSFFSEYSFAAVASSRHIGATVQLQEVYNSSSGGAWTSPTPNPTLSQPTIPDKFVSNGNGSNARTLSFTDANDLQDLGNESKQEDLKCAYGTSGGSTGKLFGQQLALSIVISLGVVVFTLLAGSILYTLFSFQGFVIAQSIACIIWNFVTIRWSTWKYLGPGTQYLRGETANRFVFGMQVYYTILNKICSLFGIILTARYAFDIEEYKISRPLTKLRVWLGVPVAFVMSAFSTYYAYTKGVPSYYLGSSGDTFNSAGCSGPFAWAQLPGYVRFVELSVVITPLASMLPIVGESIAIAEIICAALVIAKYANVYHRVTAALSLIIAIPALFRCLYPSEYSPS